MKILVAIDFSAASQKTLDIVKSRKWPAGTTIRLLHAIDVAPFADAAAIIRETERSVASSMQAASEHLKREGLIIDSEVLVESPRAGIRKYAENWNPDLIMVGCHGHSAVARMALGSVAQSVVRSAPCSVEVLRELPREEGASSAMRILIAADGSACSMAAIRLVGARPWPAGTTFRVISAVPQILPIPDVSTAYLRPAQVAQELRVLDRAAHERASATIAAARSLLNEFGILQVEAAETRRGDPRSVILEEAKLWKADLIALGSHGFHGIDRLMLGSVSEYVAAHADCSVLVARTQTEPAAEKVKKAHELKPLLVN